MNDYFEAVHKANSNYPIRFELFDGGKHGTPLRNTDWQKDLNWMFSVDRSDSKSEKPIGEANSGITSEQKEKRLAR